MPIFGKKEIEALQLQVQQLTDQLELANASLAKSTRDFTTLQLTHTKVKEELRTRVSELRQIKEERDTAVNSLAEFEKALRVSLKRLGTMLEIGVDRWIDPAAVWHVFIQPPHSITDQYGETVPIKDYTLYLNNQAVSQGSKELMTSKMNEVIEAKSKV